jgi:LysM repeat protein
MNQGIMALANAGRGGDTQIAHVRPGELVLPPEILDKDLVKSLEKKLNDAGFEYSTLVVGDEDVSINPRTGLPEFGLFSKLKKAVSSAWKGVKKILDPVTKVAQFIPGPWRAPAALYQKGKAAVNIVKGDGNFGDFATVLAGPKIFGEGNALDVFKKQGFGDLGEYTLGNFASSVRDTLGFGAGTQDYTIQSGDTLSNIAAKNNTTVEALAQANNITDPSKIVAGNVIKIPTSGGPISRIRQGIASLRGEGEQVPEGQQQGFLGRLFPGLSGSFYDDVLGIDPSGGGIFGSLKDSFDPEKGGIDPRLLAASVAYGKAVEKAAEKEAKGMTDIRDSLRPDLATPQVYGGGIGGFNLGFAKGGEVLDMRAGGESIGPGTGTSDDIPAMLSDGEFVMTAKANRGAGAMNMKKGKNGIMQLIPLGKPDREKGADNMMTLMRYFERQA